MCIGMVIIFASPLSASVSVGMSYQVPQQQGLTGYCGWFAGVNEPGEHAA
jgi:hypothetical protein